MCKLKQVQDHLAIAGRTSRLLLSGKVLRFGDSVHTSSRKPCRGFTLLEIQITLLISVVLLVFVIPLWTNILLTNRLATEANTFLSAMHLARSEAVKRNVRTVLCVSASGLSCSNTGDWHQGWIMFTDANNNTLVDANETLLRRGQTLPNNFLLTGNTPVSRYISYSPSGATRLVSGAFQAGTLKLCQRSMSSSAARLLIISSSGRPRIEKTTVASCL